MTTGGIATILVTGATGFLGRHLMPVLERHYPNAAVIGVSSADGDLTDRTRVDALLSAHRPDVVVHLAALSGGIGANRERPADFFYVNTVLTAQMFDAAARAGVAKIVYPMGGCAYPADATSPIDKRTSPRLT